MRDDPTAAPEDPAARPDDAAAAPAAGAATLSAAAVSAAADSCRGPTPPPAAAIRHTATAALAALLATAGRRHTQLLHRCIARLFLPPLGRPCRTAGHRQIVLSNVAPL